LNIFVLDQDPFIAAQYLLDKHVVKMPLETAQILCTVANKKGFMAPYKPTHMWHPATLWAGRSSANWAWLCEHGIGISQTYTKTYGKIHKCQAIIQALKERTLEIWGEQLPSSKHTPFELCMPDQYKVSDPVSSYRNYYKADKAYIAKWSNRETPNWWI
jgi:hypothetical protein